MRIQEWERKVTPDPKVVTLKLTYMEWKRLTFMLRQACENAKTEKIAESLAELVDIVTNKASG